jgi:HSP20 family molecular chaperone IbpA
MWSHAFDMLARAERLHREIFRPSGLPSRPPAWEPPVDILETARQVLVLVALPGVSADAVVTSIEGDELVVVGARVLPPEWTTAIIHRLELPQGRFERRVRLPGGRYRNVRQSTAAGCLLITLDKMEAGSG